MKFTSRNAEWSIDYNYYLTRSSTTGLDFLSVIAPLTEESRH